MGMYDIEPRRHFGLKQELILLRDAPSVSLGVLLSLEWLLTEDYFGNEFCLVCEGCKTSGGHEKDCPLDYLLTKHLSGEVASTPPGEVEIHQPTDHEDGG